MNHTKFFLTKNLTHDNNEVIYRIRKIANWAGVCAVSVFPDLHLKTKETIPTGVVFAADGLIYPQAIKSNFNCGMSIIRTSLRYSEVNRSDIELLFNELSDIFLDRKYKYWAIGKADLDNILYRGVDWVKDKFGFDEFDQVNIENNGSFFKDTDFSFKEVKRNIPHDAYKGGIKKLGSMWIGNHFLEMNRVENLLDHNTAEVLGLQKDQIIFMIHGESGSLGARIGKYFMSSTKANFKNRLRKWLYHRLTLNPQEIRERNNLYFKDHYPPIAIKADSKEGRRYIACAYAAINYGFVNRALVYKLIKNILTKYIRADIEARLLIDVSHKIIKQENIGGKMLWVHRNGASRAFGPSLMKGHPIYSKTGQPLPLPGSMTAGSYICVALDETRNSLFSVNHGTGRKINKEELERRVSNQDVYDLLEKEGIYIKRMGKGDINEQSPSGYKNLDEVMGVIRDFGLIRPVVKLKSLGVLKG